MDRYGIRIAFWDGNLVIVDALTGDRREYRPDQSIDRVLTALALEPADWAELEARSSLGIAIDGAAYAAIFDDPEAEPEAEEPDIFVDFDAINQTEPEAGKMQVEFDVSNLGERGRVLTARLSVEGCAEPIRLYMPIDPRGKEKLLELEAGSRYEFVQLGATEHAYIGYWMQPIEGLTNDTLAAFALGSRGAWDCALPQGFVDQFQRERGFFPHGVWFYPASGSVMGGFESRQDMIATVRAKVNRWVRGHDGLSIASLRPIGFGLTHDDIARAIEDRQKAAAALPNADWIDPEGWIVSSDTLHEMDLIPKLAAELEQVSPAALASIIDDFTEAYAFGVCAWDWSEARGRYYDLREHERDQLSMLCAALFDALEDNAPAGFYFSASEGDGALFGFWQVEPEAEPEY